MTILCFVFLLYAQVLNRKVQKYHNQVPVLNMDFSVNGITTRNITNAGYSITSTDTLSDGSFNSWNDGWFYDTMYYDDTIQNWYLGITFENFARINSIVIGGMFYTRSQKDASHSWFINGNKLKLPLTLKYAIDSSKNEINDTKD